MSEGIRTILAGIIVALIGVVGQLLTHSLWSLVITVPLAFIAGLIIQEK